MTSEPRSHLGGSCSQPYRAFFAASVNLDGPIQSDPRLIRSAGRYDDTANPWYSQLQNDFDELLSRGTRTIGSRGAWTTISTGGSSGQPRRGSNTNTIPIRPILLVITTDPRLR